MQMWQRGWCEAGEGHCVDPVPQGCRRWPCGGTPGLSQLEGYFQLPDLSHGVWGCPMGVSVKGVTLGRCKEQGCICTGLWDGPWKAGGQRQLKQQGFWQETVQLPRSRQWMMWWMHTQRLSPSQPPGAYWDLYFHLQGNKAFQWLTDFSSLSLKTFPEMRP